MHQNPDKQAAMRRRAIHLAILRSLFLVGPTLAQVIYKQSYRLYELILPDHSGLKQKLTQHDILRIKTNRQPFWEVAIMLLRFLFAVLMIILTGTACIGSSQLTSEQEELALRVSEAIEAIENGDSYGDKGELDRAIVEYDRAIELAPDFALSYNNRGQAYTDIGDFDQAIADLNRAIELDPDFAVAYNNRGQAYTNKGDFDQAIADLDQAIELAPDLAVAYNNRLQ
jgi:tetratricopeptide (TPR) repeat protein